MTIKTYSELITLPTFEERYRYLRLDGVVGEETFGFNRYLNQKFYRTDKEWLRVRDYVIARDNGCDLGVPDRKIPDGAKILVHHIDPIDINDVINRTRKLLDPDNLISTIKNTHDAIHYGDEGLLITEPITRTEFDTCPWRLPSKGRY
jgi:hypothetical protein